MVLRKIDWNRVKSDKFFIGGISLLLLNYALIILLFFAEFFGFFRVNRIVFAILFLMAFLGVLSVASHSYDKYIRK